MSDSWNLRKIFVFDEENIFIHNDTSNEVDYINKENRSFKLKPNSIVQINARNEDFNIPNLDTIRISDKKIDQRATFDENLSIITRCYRKQLKEGQIKKGLEFLDYHYNKAQSKKDFIQFVKYYFLSKYWLPKEKREKDWLVEEWIKSKEAQNERPKYLWIIALILIGLISGVIFLDDYREILFGAILGIILGRFDKLLDKLTIGK